MISFRQEAFDWMAAISLNNSREQFVSSKSEYEEFVREPFTRLLGELSNEFGGAPKIFRPNRDVRFSADKNPYKTNISGFLEGAESTFYLDLSLEGLMAATGFYQMAKDQLVRSRAVLSGEDSLGLGNELREIIESTGAKGDGLKTVPRGIPRDHPNADLLRYTSLTCSATVLADAVIGSNLVPFASEIWNRARPLNQWLDHHVGPSLESWH